MSACGDVASAGASSVLDAVGVEPTAAASTNNFDGQQVASVAAHDDTSGSEASLVGASIDDDNWPFFSLLFVCSLVLFIASFLCKIIVEWLYLSYFFLIF